MIIHYSSIIAVDKFHIWLRDSLSYAQNILELTESVQTVHIFFPPTTYICFQDIYKILRKWKYMRHHTFLYEFVYI